MDLKPLLHKPVLLVLHDGSIVVGLLQAFDGSNNVILAKAHERVYMTREAFYRNLEPSAGMQAMADDQKHCNQQQQQQQQQQRDDDSRGKRVASDTREALATEPQAKRTRLEFDGVTVRQLGGLAIRGDSM